MQGNFAPTMNGGKQLEHAKRADRKGTVDFHPETLTRHLTMVVCGILVACQNRLTSRPHFAHLSSRPVTNRPLNYRVIFRSKQETDLDSRVYTGLPILPKAV